MTRIALALAAAGTLVLAGSAFAESSTSDAGRLNVARDQWKSPTVISEMLVTQGYKVHEIEQDDGAYEVKVTDKNGVRVEMYVHPVTAELLPGYDD